MTSADTTLRAALIAMTLGLLSGCKSPPRESVHLVAVGARDRVPSVLGPCRTADARPSAPVQFSLTGDIYEAMSKGRVRIPCEQGVVVLDVRRPTRLDIDSSRVAKRGDMLAMQVRVFDEENTRLTIGAAPVSWSFTGALAPRQAPVCDDGEEACPLRNVGLARAYDDGASEVVARFGPLSARIVVNVLP